MDEFLQRDDDDACALNITAKSFFSALPFCWCLNNQLAIKPDFKHVYFCGANLRCWWWYLLMYKGFKSLHAQHTASTSLSQQAGERGCHYTTLKPSYLFTRAAATNLITDKKSHAGKFVLIYAPRRPAAKRTGWKRREIWSVIGTGSDFSSSQRINIWMRMNGIKIRERNTLFFNK